MNQTKPKWNFNKKWWFQ